MSILEIIKQIKEDKIRRKIIPTHALFLEVKREANKLGIEDKQIRAELNELYNFQLIKVGPTINDKFIELV